MTEENKPLYLKKSAILNHMPIVCDTVHCSTTYRDNISSSGLCTHEISEIDMIIAGSGTHLVLNQAIPCKTGDVFIICPNVPHGYFAAEAKNPLTVQRLNKRIVQDFIDNQRFCQSTQN